MRPTLYTVPLDGPGQLSIMAKPDADWLETQLAALREDGVDVLVSALTPAETAEAGLGDEALEASAAGLRFVSLPITDMGLPDRDSVMPILRELVADLAAGRHVVTHCWTGVGRSSLLAASLMVLTGITPDEAVRRISQVRGRAVPETAEQRAWIFDVR
ncbi:tyrosine protein phosphatase [Kibdelosporangium persicum]|uniref:Tyrosine protein phosphatase n=1 Tax=Kibdelosporangium persicum TaxID=2698649 RepID=A0ABX2EWI5_9PSEU|nr:tyrosine protein phosphatase [Kibdelosporangium persicum]NRN63379.1 Tyrosine protein phosphatase [Kibdelosporangium persicum]